jgi:hypothetical protein
LATQGSPQQRYTTLEAPPELMARQVFRQRLEPTWPELWAPASLKPRQLAMQPVQPASAEVVIAPALLLVAVWERRASQLQAQA